MSCSAHVLVKREQTTQLLPRAHVLSGGNIVRDFLALAERGSSVGVSGSSFAHFLQDLGGFVLLLLMICMQLSSPKCRYFGILPGLTASDASRIRQDQQAYRKYPLSAILRDCLPRYPESLR